MSYPSEHDRSDVEAVDRGRARQDETAATDAERSIPGEIAQRPSGKRLLIALFVAVACAALAGNAAVAIARSVAPAWAADLDKLAPVVVAVVYVVVTVALLLVMGRTRAQRDNALALRPAGRRAVARGVVVWAGAYLAAAAFYVVTGAVGGSGLDDAVDFVMSIGADNGRLGTASALLVVVIIVRMVLLAPLAEELLFRGALFTWLRTRLSARWTILLTGVAFGLIHQSLTFLPLAILIGIAAGWIRERTGSVLVPMAVHVLQNALILVVSLLVTGWDTPAFFG